MYKAKDFFSNVSNYHIIIVDVPDPKPSRLRRLWLLLTFRRWRQTFHKETRMVMNTPPPAGKPIVAFYETDYDR